MIKEKIAKLIDLKTIATILITIGLLWGFMNKIIDAEKFMTIVVMVYTFYFTRPKEEGRG